ncbi:hypothetical protein OH710_01415 [Pseudomonas capsici]|uniref:DUF6966 domain-containing protein n=1 Tax=Pseudomonas capsici TaxID=2810614 RepID=UPI001910F64B|nr:hypothetical protein [Pseudomonas capsici]MBX8613329.1 hypothetical protein [Pseudomonas cichorii]MCV4271288.1 hypothetical protein [Pseudomonas capsici]GFM69257.1 hypothetical protein PSCICL_02490 [Pseudomonas cichorii]
MDTKTEKLISVLDELVAVLESDGEEHWSQWMRDARTRLADSDPSGMTRLRSAYGGMGSFNDLVLGQSYRNGALCWKSGHGELNQRFYGLRDEVYRLLGEVGCRG